MNEKPKPTLRDRLGGAAVSMVTIGLVGLGGTMADIKITSNAIDNEVNRTIPPTASYEGLTEARKEITIFDQRSHELIQQGETVISISKITGSSKLQQAITLVDEEQERQKQAFALSHKLYMQSLRRHIVTGAASTVLAFTGLFLWKYPKRTDANQQKRPLTPIN